MAINLSDYQISFSTIPTDTEVLGVDGVITIYKWWGKVRDTGDVQPLGKTVVQVDGSTSNQVALDTWANRATATYEDLRGGE